MLLTNEVTEVAQKGGNVGFQGVFYLDVQKSVNIAYKTKQKKSTGNRADSHTVPLWCSSSIAAGPQGQDAELALRRCGQGTEKAPTL